MTVVIIMFMTRRSHVAKQHERSEDHDDSCVCLLHAGRFQDVCMTSSCLHGPALQFLELLGSAASNLDESMGYTGFP
jgi:hypothetical protein